MNKPLTEEELLFAIRNLKTKSSSGLDGIDYHQAAVSYG